VEFYHPIKIYLFGSIARGDAGPDSDLDFCVVVPDDTPPEKFRQAPHATLCMVFLPQPMSCLGSVPTLNSAPPG
jgi:predicted nucleotidyltransferase